MKLYWYFSVHEDLFHHVADTLRRQYGIADMGGFTWGKNQRRRLERSGFPWKRIDVFSDWLRELPNWKLDADYVARAEKRYGPPNFAVMASADRHLVRGRSYDEVMKIIEISLRRFEQILDEARPEAIYFESVDSLPIYLLYAMARDRGIQFLQIDPGRIFGRAARAEGPFQMWSEVDALFREYGGGSLPDAARARAEAFIHEFRKERPRVVVPKRRWLPGAHVHDLGRLARGASEYLSDPLNPTLTHPFKMVGQRVARAWRFSMASKLGYFENPVPREKFILYPMHYEPEVSTLVLGAFYSNQIALLEDIAKSIPVGYRLYVKDHFVGVGRRRLADYRRLRQLPAVRLIRWDAKPHDLIRDCAAVATISGTMGWEASLMGKPVITFGEMFYNSLPTVIKAGRLAKSDWPALFRQAVEGVQPDYETLVCYVAAILDATYEGFFSASNPHTDPECLDVRNYENMARVIASALRPSTEGLKAPLAEPSVHGGPPARLERQAGEAK